MKNTQTFEFTADPADLAEFRGKLRGLLQQSGLNEKKSGEVILSVDEALTNIYRHAYQKQPGKIHLSFQDEEDRIEIWVRDAGKKFNPLTLPAPELPPVKPGGLGIHLIKNLMDRVEYDGGFADGNRLGLVKYKDKS